MDRQVFAYNLYIRTTRPEHARMTKLTLPFLAVLFLWLAPSSAMAEGTAYVTNNVHLRAGPDARYPSVAILRSGERVELLGCVNGWQWCEVETRDDERGWTAAYYLRTLRGNSSLTIIESNNYGGTRVIIYKPYDYWDAHYRNKYFYRDRDKWLGRRPAGYGRDHDDHHGHDQDNHHGRPSKPRPAKEIEEPRYKKQEIPQSRAKYNPLCRMGESEC